MGVAVGPHAAEGSVTVVDFVSRELADGELPTMEIEAVDEIPEEVQKQIEDLGLKGKVKLVKGGNLTKEELKKKAEREYLKQNKSAAAKSFAPPPSKLNRPTTAATNPNKLEVKSGINKSSSKSKIKSTKDDNSVVTSKSSLQKPQAKGVSSKINSQDPKTTRTPVPNKTKIIDVNLSKPSLKPKESLISKISKFNPPNPISESKPEHEEEKGNYTVCKNKIDPSELEVFSDYSYDKSTDLDLPPNLKSVTCTTEIVKGANGREMVIRKQYYLNDGRELRVKNIRPVKDKI